MMKKLELRLRELLNETIAEFRRRVTKTIVELSLSAVSALAALLKAVSERLM